MSSQEMLFFEYNYFETFGESFTVSNRTKVCCKLDCYALKYARSVISRCFENGKDAVVHLIIGIPDHIITKIGADYSEHPEGYVLEVSGEEINIFASTTRGLIYGVSTLRRLIEAELLSGLLLYDRPDKVVRGYRVYLPGRDSIEDFEEMIDTLIEYKYNSVIMEVGGAMEYKRHPEINETWHTFCTHVNSIPNEANRIQRETPQMKWAKDSIHSENGRGNFISQEQVRRIVNYCKEREITVIPEVPSLSHSDYIVMPHPELNERVYDEYPDTYCPSNPKSYEILFDIIDEVVEVFEPEFLNIGHDEVYSIALCDRCRGKDPVELFVNDIRKINDYLKSKHVKAMMWCDKLFNAHQGEFPVGGALIERFGIPEMYQSRCQIPNDITLLNWYWSLCEPEEQKLLTEELGFRMIYGNYVAIQHTNYRETSWNVDGAFVSNWGYSEEEYMQRNQQYYALVTTAYVLWSSTYSDADKDRLLQKAETELHNRYLSNIVGNDYIEIIHTTDEVKEDGYFWCGHYIYDEDWVLGHYCVTYSDGSQAALEVRYGYNITSSTLLPGSIDYSRALGACLPCVIDGRQYYKTAYTNPYPQKEITAIVFEAIENHTVEMLHDHIKICSKSEKSIV